MSRSTDNLLSVTKAPASVPDTSGKRPGVRRLNNIPLYIVGAIVLSFALIIALVSASKSSQNAQTAEEKGGDNAQKLANSLLSEMPQDGGVISAKPTASDIPNLPDLDVASAPISLPESPPMPEADQDIERVRQAKTQMFQDALGASTKVNAVAAASSGSSRMYGETETAAPKTRDEMLSKIAEVQRMAANTGNGGSEAERIHAQLSAKYDPRNRNQNAGDLSSPPVPASLNSDSSDEGKWRLNSQVVAPNTYMIRTGSVIPATLISGVNSDLPGMIQAQISQNVYDTISGKHLLLPQGSRLVGTYESNVAFGQRRLFIAWNRIVFPDGKALDIGAMPGASGAGYAGFKDQVNNHYARIWGNALMLSLVGASISYTVDRNSSNDNESTVKGALSESLGQTFGQVVTQSLQKNMNISPTLEIRPGYRFNVIITKDIDFSKPYRTFDF